MVLVVEVFVSEEEDECGEVEEDEEDESQAEEDVSELLAGSLASLASRLLPLAFFLLADPVAA